MGPRTARRFGNLLLAAIIASGCERSPATDRAAVVEATRAPVRGQASNNETGGEPGRAPSTGGQQLAERLEPISAPGRIVAVGDLHGDLSAARRALELAGAIDASGRWIGKDLTVVQTGDVLDRGDDEREIYEYLWELRAEASRAGGRIVLLNGNHEVLNVEADLRYVTPGGLLDFADVDTSPLGPGWDRVPPQMQGRVAAFLPGGPWARRLAEHPVVALVDETLFAHAGVLDEHVRLGLVKLNKAAAEWMRGELRAPPPALTGEEAPVWTRRYGEEAVAPAVCRELGEVLTVVSARRLVVGHTVQRGGISSACDGKLWRIDVGLSRYYGDGRNQVLEIDEGNVRVLGH